MNLQIAILISTPLITAGCNFIINGKITNFRLCNCYFTRLDITVWRKSREHDRLHKEQWSTKLSGQRRYYKTYLLDDTFVANMKHQTTNATRLTIAILARGNDLAFLQLLGFRPKVITIHNPCCFVVLHSDAKVSNE